MNVSKMETVEMARSFLRRGDPFSALLILNEECDEKGFLSSKERKIAKRALALLSDEEIEELSK